MFHILTIDNTRVEYRLMCLLYNSSHLIDHACPLRATGSAADGVVAGGGNWVRLVYPFGGVGWRGAMPRPNISAALLGAGSALGCKALILLGFGEIGSVWYFFAGCAGLLARRARGWRWGAGRRGVFVSWAFVSSLPQVGGVGGDLPVHVVVRSLVSLFVIS